MSCLFNSISYFLQEDPQVIRNKICDYLHQGHPIISGLNTQEVLEIDGTPNYVETMRKTSTWGGAIEIQAACNIWSMSVNVIDVRDACRKVVNFVPVNNVYSKSITLEWSGGHYEPLKSV
jgi:hypothetical protein